MTPIKRKQAGKGIFFSLNAFLLGSRRAPVQCEPHVWLTELPSWCLHDCIHLAPMTVTCHSDAVRLTGNVRGPDRWRCLRSSEPMQDDLSPDGRPQPVIYLLTTLMWVKWAGAGGGAVRGKVTRGKGKVNGYRKEKPDRPFSTSKYQQQPFHTSQWAC